MNREKLQKYLNQLEARRYITDNTDIAESLYEHGEVIEKVNNKITVRFNEHIYTVHLNGYASAGTKITKFQ